MKLRIAPLEYQWNQAVSVPTLNVVHFIGLDKTVMTYNFGMLQSLGSQS